MTPHTAAAVTAVRAGDVGASERLLSEHPDLAGARVAGYRPLPHVVADRPGHLPRGTATVTALVAAGAEVDVRFCGTPGEAPLHRAASCDDVDVLDARGAHTTLVDAAMPGLPERVLAYLAGDSPPTAEEIDAAFWGACHGRQRRCAEVLRTRGAAIDRLPSWERLTPLDAALRRHADELAGALRERGALSADELG